MASKESAGSQPSLGRLPAQAPPPFPRGSPAAPHFDPEACRHLCEENGLVVGRS